MLGFAKILGLIRDGQSFRLRERSVNRSVMCSGG
jgi:hypothetical protein